MRSKNEVLCAAAGRLAAERSEADKPTKAHKTIFAPNNIILYYILSSTPCSSRCWITLRIDHPSSNLDFRVFG
jgi:hypothetical protein